MIGTRLSHYEITRHLGSGGMGEVYQATDSRLGRSVAIKLLPDVFSKDEERVARFQREARVLASLSHPHIAGIHGIEESDGRLFLVLELVDGETLEERIRQGPIPLDEALGAAHQIAAALEAAHDAGIVHRDLKPANIKLTPDGQVKVLDFGLAKAFSNRDVSESDATRSPTISLAATQRGIILGTAAYMAPEQARGKAVDRRADIWAFGVVLYEMVTGRRLFKGEDYTDTLAAVVREKPDLSAAPPAVRPVLEKCLEKDPKKRMGHISAFPLLLQADAPEPAAAAPIPLKSMRAWAPWSLTAVASLFLAGLAYIHFSETPPELQAVGFDLEPPPGFQFTNPFGGFAASPDGQYVVFSARSDGAPQLWLRPLSSSTARPLPGTEGGNFPTWSPDSKSLAFGSEGKLKRIDIAGGAPLILGDAPVGAVSVTGTWSPQGVILVGSATGLMRVSASGGGAAPVTTVDAAKQETGHGYPQFLPGGERFLYFAASGDPTVQGIYVSSLQNPQERRQILRTAAKAIFVSGRSVVPDYLLWLQEQTLLAQEFDPGTLELKGDPTSVAENIGLAPGVPIRAGFWASDAGLLTYFAQPTGLKRPIALRGKDGKPLDENLPEDTFVSVAMSPQGDRLAVARVDGSSQPPNRDVWVRELSRGVMTRLTFDALTDDNPVWSPDGKEIAFSSNRDGEMQIYRKDASGAGSEVKLTEGPNPKLVLEWSNDKKYLLYRERSEATGRDIMALQLDGERKPFAVVNTPFSESTAALSPDGKWVAYASNDSGTFEIYAQAFPGVAGAPSGRWQISTGGGYEVKWRGKEIYYQSVSGDAGVMAVAVETGPQGVQVSSPRELFKADFQRGNLHEFDVSPDGRRFALILNRPDREETNRLTVVTNWQATLRR